MPFLFPNKLLTEGMRSAVTCQILEGNLPINFIWRKNGVSLVSQQTTTNNDVMNLIKNNVVRYALLGKKGLRINEMKCTKLWESKRTLDSYAYPVKSRGKIQNLK